MLTVLGEFMKLLKNCLNFVPVPARTVYRIRRKNNNYDNLGWGYTIQDVQCYFFSASNLSNAYRLSAIALVSLLGRVGKGVEAAERQE